MNAHAEFALAYPVFDPMTQILPGHFWFVNSHLSAGLTVNIGIE